MGTTRSCTTSCPPSSCCATRQRSCATYELFAQKAHRKTHKTRALCAYRAALTRVPRHQDMETYTESGLELSAKAGEAYAEDLEELGARAEKKGVVLPEEASAAADMLGDVLSIEARARRGARVRACA